MENLARAIVIIQLKDPSCSLKLKVDFSREQIRVSVNRNLDSLSAVASGGTPLAHHHQPLIVPADAIVRAEQKSDLGYLNLFYAHKV